MTQKHMQEILGCAVMMLGKPTGPVFTVHAGPLRNQLVDLGAFDVGDKDISGFPKATECLIPIG